MSLRFAPAAERDLERAVGYLVTRNPAAASRFAARVFSVLDELEAGDFDGPETRLSSGE